MSLFKSRTFITGLASALTGAVLTVTGYAAVGAPMLISGIGIMLGRNATEKVKKQVNDLNQVIQQTPVSNFDGEKAK